MTRCVARMTAISEAGSGYVSEVCTFLKGPHERLILKALTRRLVRWRNGDSDCYTCTHHPLAIIAYTNTLTGFLEFEILQEFDTIGVVGVVLETAFSLSG